MWNNGSYDCGDPDNPSRTGVSTTNAVILEITRVRNLVNHTPSRFNLLAGDLCHAQAQGDIQPIINPNEPTATSPPHTTRLSRPPTAVAGTTTTRGSGRAGSR
jgi:hypothetical protein